MTHQRRPAKTFSLGFAFPDDDLGGPAFWRQALQGTQLFARGSEAEERLLSEQRRDEGGDLAEQ